MTRNFQINPDSYSNSSNLVELLRRRAGDQPDKLAYTYLVDGETEEVHLTYQELDQKARAIGAWLQGRGMAGERALLLYPPGLDFTSAFFGCLYAGVVAVPAYPPRLNRPMPRIQAIVADAQATLALTTTTILANIEQRFEHAPDLESLRWLNTEHLPADLKSEWREPNIAAEKLAFLQYTSGSTSAPKGVMLSHSNLMHNLEVIRGGFQIDQETVGTFWLPSYHDMGFVGGILEPLYIGCSTVLMSPASFLQRPARWLQAITRYKGTVSGAPNFAYELCVEKITPEVRATLDLSSWRVAFCGAEPIRQETLERFAETFEPYGFRRQAFYPCYGLAEATLLVAGGDGPGPPILHTIRRGSLEKNRAIPADTGDKDAQTLVSSGHALLDQEIAIVDPDDLTRCPPEQVGEIWVSGSSVSPGYWGHPQETERTLQASLADTGEGPFLRTGDLGFLHDGELFVTGRLKDLIIIRGRNHYPQDIEQTVESSHHAVQPGAGAAFSVDVDGEERLVIVYELERQHRNASLDEVLAAIRHVVVERHELAPYAVVLVKPLSIPKTSSGKTQRFACKAGFLEGSLKVKGEWQAPLPAPSTTEKRAVLAGGGGPSESMDSPAESPSAGVIEAWLATQIAARLGINVADIDTSQPFAHYGLDSVQAVNLTGDMEIWLDRSLSPTLIWDYPNIEALSLHLAAQSPLPAPSVRAGYTFPTVEPIAVIGLGCRFPGADGPDAFWQLLRDGVDAITEVPSDRWDVEALYNEIPATPGKMNTRWGGFLKEVDRFDPHFFGISPREAARMDPQQRLLLEVSWEALEHAGQVPDELSGSQTGVFVGISSYDYSRLQFSDPARIDAYAGTGNAHSIAANRLSYVLDLRGPSIAVDTACSSSLVAVHLAMRSLRNGESDLALAGGVNLILSPELTVSFSQARMMAPDGRCKTFDSRADGYVRGEGCGMVVLKRLTDALREGDGILAVLRGSAMNQDGRSNGLTAPNGPSQQAVIRQALKDAGVSPAQLGYVEAHGTGTPLGDPIEVQSLRAVLPDRRSAKQTCALGSVKTNFGHLEAAAGIAGLIKVVLALNHEEIPPHLHLEKISPHISLDGSSLEIVTERRPWPRGSTPRLAGVSSFGFGGTNSHVVVSEAPRIPVAHEPDREPESGPVRLLPLSARSAEALRSLAQDHKDFLMAEGSGSAVSLQDICYTASVRRNHHDHRLALVGQSHEEIIEQLEAFLRGEARSGMSTDRKAPGHRRKLVFVFPGQGSQWVGMGRELMGHEPIFREALERCDMAMRKHTDWSLLEELVADEAQSRMEEIDVVQPALFAIQVALADLWRSWGIEPDVMVGHSMGEIAAAHVAGALTLEDAVSVICRRSQLLKRVSGQGSMAAVELSTEQAQHALTGYEDRLSIAVSNSPTSTVLSGDSAALREVTDRLQAQDIFCRLVKVDVASHSPQMDSLRPDLLQALEGLQPGPATVPIYSTVTNALSDGLEFDSLYWVRNLRETVRFSPAIQHLLSEGHDIFLEISPHPILLSAIKQGMNHLGMEGTVLPSLGRDKPEPAVMQGSLGALYTQGFPLDWTTLYPSGGRFIRLPSYPWQRERFWLDADGEAEGSSMVPAPQRQREALKHPLLGRRLSSPLRIYENRLDLSSQDDLPATYRDIGLAAATELFGSGSHQVEEFMLAEPARLTHGELRLQTIVTGNMAGSASFQIYSQSQGQDTWSLQASGKISPGQSSGTGEASDAENRPEAVHGASLNREALLSEEPEKRQPLVELFLQSHTAKVLGLDPSRLDANQPLDRLGLDSLMAIELKNSVDSDLGVVLPIVNFLQGSTISQLAQQVLDNLATTSAATALPLTPAPAADASGEHPLSYGQKALWFLHELLPEGISFNVAGAVRIRGGLDVPSLRRAFEGLVDRQASLRTTFTMSAMEPLQRVHEKLELSFQEQDASDWNEAELRTRLIREAYRPFDLEKGPPLRVILYSNTASRRSEASDSEYVLLLAMDHIVTDFWSMTVLAQELMALYQAERKGVPALLEPLAVQYTDYVAWQKDMLASPEGERQWAYWQEQLGGGLPVLDLPTDRPRRPFQTFRGDSQAIRLGADLAAGLKELSKAHGATLYMTLLAAFQALLHRYTGRRDLLVGSVTTGRSHSDLAGLVGYFLNPIALRADFSENPTFAQFLGQVRRTVLDAMDHDGYPPVLLAERLGLQRDPSRPPLFETMFILQKAQLPDIAALSPFALGIAGARMEIAGLVLESVDLGGQPAQFDLTLLMAEMGEGLAASIQYNADLFDQGTIQRMLLHFRNMLEAVVAEPEQPISSIPLLTQSERKQMLLEWNDTEVDYPHNACIHQLLEAQAERTPDSIAAIYEGEQLTYRELNRRANQLAQHLQRLGVGPETLVGIYIDRSLEMLLGLLGTLKAGGAYVPLDPAHPPERLARILEDAQPLVLLTQERLVPTLPEHTARLVSIDAEWEKIALGSEENPVSGIESDSLAYVIYTSGSTGEPKGVEVTHRGVVNLLRSMHKQPGLSAEDVLLAVTTLTFDIAMLELLLPLTIGARVELVSREVASDGVQLMERLAHSGATVMQATPATWRMLLEAGWQPYEEPADSAPNKVRRSVENGLKILCGGEALPRDLADQLLKRGASLWNLYGPTETTIWSTVYQVQSGKGPVPIGRPIDNTQVYLLDTQMQPVPVGMVGELYIGGDGVARGYLNRPELTAEKFVSDPFSERSDARLYRTGDLARYLADGHLEFLGRRDHQVKVRGFRIELGEVESALAQHPAIRQNIVVTRGDMTGDNRLVCYLIPHSEQAKPPASELRNFLREVLPDYMLPSAFVTLEAMPLTPNGKVNRRALPAPAPERPEPGGAYLAPRTPLEGELAAICAEVLGLRRVGVRDNFFDLGGHSLLGTQFIFRLRDKYQVKLPLRRLFEQPTVEALAQAIEVARKAPEGAPLEASLFGSMTLDDLNAEVVLDTAIRGENLRYEAVAEPSQVFLTGSTGFIGAFLLHELLHETQADVHCLVRAADADEGLRRIRANLESYSLWDETLGPRIIAVPGDLEQPKLGLSEEQFQRLSERMEIIYHNGARVYLIDSYQAHKAANVLGTEEVLRLAVTGRLKPVSYVSTLAIFHTGGQDNGTVFRESDDLDQIGAPVGGYEQSKWVAEKLLMLASSRGIPMAIYRPGLVSGHSQMGAWNTRDMTSNLVKACVSLGSVPDLEMLVDVVPVDYVSRAIVHLSRQPESWGKVFHLCNPQPFDYKEVIEWVRSRGFPIQEVPFDQWRVELFDQAIRAPDSGWAPFLPLIEELEEGQVYMPQFDCQNTLDGLEGSRIEYPPDGHRLLDTYLAYFVRSGFLEAAR